jgi:uncharacterized protein (TIGR02246 family)
MAQATPAAARWQGGFGAIRARTERAAEPALRVARSIPGRTRHAMSSDERAIRDLVETWMAATKAGDTARVLSLMADDAVFMVPGQEPFGKEAFAAASKALKGMTFDGKSDIRELRVLGDWAYLRSFIRVAITPAGDKPARRQGWTLTILRKEGGRWLLARDANLMVPA